MTGLELAAGLSARRVRETVGTVLRGEGAGHAEASVTFLSSQRMRVLNRRTFRRDRATDVIAFGMRHDGRLVADLYVCPAVARREARQRRIAFHDELLRLLVHGTLHATGWDHPGGAERQHSAMWDRQERYLHRLGSDG